MKSGGNKSWSLKVENKGRVNYLFATAVWCHKGLKEIFIIFPVLGLISRVLILNAFDVFFTVYFR